MGGNRNGVYCEDPGNFFVVEVRTRRFCGYREDFRFVDVMVYGDDTTRRMVEVAFRKIVAGGKMFMADVEI